VHSASDAASPPLNAAAVASERHVRSFAACSVINESTLSQGRWLAGGGGGGVGRRALVLWRPNPPGGVTDAKEMRPSTTTKKSAPAQPRETDGWLRLRLRLRLRWPRGSNQLSRARGATIEQGKDGRESSSLIKGESDSSPTPFSGEIGRRRIRRRTKKRGSLVASFLSYHGH